MRSTGRATARPQHLPSLQKCQKQARIRPVCPFLCRPWLGIQVQFQFLFPPVASYLIHRFAGHFPGCIKHLVALCVLLGTRCCLCNIQDTGIFPSDIALSLNLGLSFALLGVLLIKFPPHFPFCRCLYSFDFLSKTGFVPFARTRGQRQKILPPSLFYSKLAFSRLS